MNIARPRSTRTTRYLRALAVGTAFCGLVAATGAQPALADQITAPLSEMGTGGITFPPAGGIFFSGTVTGNPVNGTITGTEYDVGNQDSQTGCFPAMVAVTLTDTATSTLTKSETGTFCPLPGPGGNRRFTGTYTITGGTGTYAGATGSGDSTIDFTFFTGDPRDLRDPFTEVMTFSSTETGTVSLPTRVTLTSPAPTAPVVGDTYTPTATGGPSGQPVVLGATGACTLTGGVVTFTHAGDCTVTADQAGDSNAAADQAAQVIRVDKAPQAITFTTTAPTTAVVDGTYTPTATGGPSGQPIVFEAIGACTLTGGVVTFTGAGPCTVTADQAGTTDYTAAPQQGQVVQVEPAAQAITFTSTPPTAVVGGSYTPTATGGPSGQPIVFGATGACALTGGVVTFTGTGPCSITANQAGTTDYTPAPQATQPITVGAVTSRVTYPLTGTATVTGRAPVPFGPIPLTATLSSTGTTVAGTGFTDGTLASTPTTFTGTVFGFLPATVTAHLVTTTPVTATTTTTATTLTTSVRLVVDQVSVFGLGLVTPGSTCATTTPSTVTLTGTPGVLTTGGTLGGGTFTASTFSGCGFLAPFLEPQLNQIAGVPQAISVALGKPSTVTTTG